MPVLNVTRSICFMNFSLFIMGLGGKMAALRGFGYVPFQFPGFPSFRGVKLYLSVGLPG